MILSSRLASIKKWFDADGERVTYIAGLRSPESIVLSADTQETHNEEVIYTEKIEPRDCGTYTVAIAGAGRSELVDGFVSVVTENARQSNPATGEALKTLVGSCLVDFYRNDVRLLPGKHKGIAFLIAATRVDGNELHSWRTSGMRLFDVAKKAVVGYRAPFATYVLGRLYKNSLPLSQLILLSAYLVAIAKDSGVSVGGDTQIVIVNRNGIFSEDKTRIEDMLKRLVDYEQRMNQIFLNCADTRVSHAELEKSLAEFSKMALSLHKHYKGVMVSQLAVLVLADAQSSVQSKPSDAQKSEPEQ